jgi:hypothetical protein
MKRLSKDNEDLLEDKNRHEKIIHEKSQEIVDLKKKLEKRDRTINILQEEKINLNLAKESSEASDFSSIAKMINNKIMNELKHIGEILEIKEKKIRELETDKLTLKMMLKRFEKIEEEESENKTRSNIHEDSAGITDDGNFFLFL